MKAPKTPADTRPISILPAISKFVKKLAQHQLVEYVETYHLMSEQQHGHSEHRSTETALAVIADRVHHAKGRGDISNLTILDRSKGSVIVPHQPLLDKLSTNGIDTKWFHNLVQNKTYGVASTPMCRRMFKLRKVNSVTFLNASVRFFLYPLKKSS